LGNYFSKEDIENLFELRPAIEEAAAKQDRGEFIPGADPIHPGDPQVAGKLPERLMMKNYF
jgi:hypothetical protein